MPVKDDKDETDRDSISRSAKEDGAISPEGAANDEALPLEIE